MMRSVLAGVLAGVAAVAGTIAAGQTLGVVDARPSDGTRWVDSRLGVMVAYRQAIPGAGAEFEMVPVPGGVVRLPVGAEEGEEQYCEVELPPFWIGRHEVTWAEYRSYMALDSRYSELQQLAAKQPSQLAALRETPALQATVQQPRTAEAAKLGVDAVTAPTPLYDPSTTYESGEDPRLPAVTMTPYAARQYTKWLSALCGHDYRLPSEAEWLHAAAAGEPIDFSSEGDAEALEPVAWHTDNSDWVAHPVGQKAPNEWGLHDTLGNVAELVLDRYPAASRQELAGERVTWEQAVAWPTDGSSRMAKGGWYDAEPGELAFAARMLTDESEWKSSDPNLPASPWWYADYPSTGVGFRLVRPLEPIPARLRSRVWDTQDATVAKAVDERLREGRGKLGPIGAELPQVLRELENSAVRALLE